VLFADSMVLLASSEQGLQHVLARFSAACDQAEKQISTEKTHVQYDVSPEIQDSAG